MDKATRFFTLKDTERKWHLVNAEGKTLGRVATEIARLLRGKHKPEFTPNADLGDFVVVVNAAKVKLTGKRAENEGILPLHRVSGRRHVGEIAGSCCGSIRTACSNTRSRACCRTTGSAARYSRNSKSMPAPDHPHVAQQPQSYTRVMSQSDRSLTAACTHTRTTAVGRRKTSVARVILAPGIRQVHRQPAFAGGILPPGDSARERLKPLEVTQLSGKYRRARQC